MVFGRNQEGSRTVSAMLGEGAEAAPFYRLYTVDRKFVDNIIPLLRSDYVPLSFKVDLLNLRGDALATRSEILDLVSFHLVNGQSEFPLQERELSDGSDGGVWVGGQVPREAVNAETAIEVRSKDRLRHFVSRRQVFPSRSLKRELTADLHFVGRLIDLEGGQNFSARDFGHFKVNEDMVRSLDGRRFSKESQLLCDYLKLSEWLWDFPLRVTVTARPKGFFGGGPSDAAMKRFTSYVLKCFKNGYELDLMRDSGQGSNDSDVSVVVRPVIEVESAQISSAAAP